MRMSNKNKELFPELRFPEYKKEPPFKETKLSKLLFETKQRNRDLKFSKDDVLSVSGDHGCVNQIELLGRSYAGVSVKDYHIVETNDIVYTKSPLKKNPYGIIKENKGHAGIVSTLYAVYRATDICHPSFLDHYFSRDFNLNSYLQPLVNKGAKNDMKVKNSDVLKGTIYVPGLEEQVKLANFLSSIDKLITLHTQKLDTLKDHKKGLMQQVFPIEGETVPKLRFTGFKGSWKKSKIKNHVDLLSGYAFKSEFFAKDGKKLLMPKNFTKDGFASFNEENTKFTVEECDEKYVCKNGDLLLLLTDLTPTCELLGRPIYLREDDGEVLLNQRIAKIFVDEQLKIEFLLYYFSTHEYLKRIRATATGTTVRHSSNKIILDTSIKFPSLEEQCRIVRLLTSVDEAIEAQDRRVNLMEVYKKGLIQQVFPVMDNAVS